MRSVIWVTVSIWLFLGVASISAADEVVTEQADEEVAPALNWLWSHTKIQALWYLHYFYEDIDGETSNRFEVSRGYTTFKFKLNDWFGARTTVDVYEDDDGWELRFKYLYAWFKWPIETLVISNPAIEFGLIHVPWLGYEESINRYRMIGKMFLERNHLFNSADLGVAFTALLGEPLDEEHCQTIDCHYPGTWGSLSVGMFNGGGYHNIESNENKVLMARVSIRPLGAWLPNLSLSYSMIHGAGNTSDEPTWRHHAGFASYEHEYFVATAHGATGEGNQKGDHVNADGAAQSYVAVSGFVEGKLPWINSAIFGRYDWFEWDTDDGEQETTRLIAGLAYYFYGDCAFVLDYDRLFSSEGEESDDWSVKLTMQVYLH